MDKVYFLKDFSKIEKKVKELLDGFYAENKEVITKIHFGEPGNNFAFKAQDIEPLAQGMKSLELKPVFIDTPVAYSSPRGTVKDYEQVVKERGYDKLAPFIISDNYVKIEAKDFIVEVCRELIEAENVLVVSHVKGHSLAGFGGAIKNLAMGGVSIKSKNDQHSLCCPKFVAECQGCGTCAQLCPSKAIEMIDGKAELNNDKCWGCSICQIECSYKCLAPEKAFFDDLLGQAAAAIINNLPKQTFYINFLKNIVKLCDCAANPGEPISKDIGVLFSKNPVAIDKASVDLINKANSRDLFKEINRKDPLLHVKSAAGYTKKAMDYELIEI